MTLRMRRKGWRAASGQYWGSAREKRVRTGRTPYERPGGVVGCPLTVLLTILKLVCGVCGANPSSLDRDRARSRQIREARCRGSARRCCEDVRRAIVGWLGRTLIESRAWACWGESWAALWNSWRWEIDSSGRWTASRLPGACLLVCGVHVESMDLRFYGGTCTPLIRNGSYPVSGQ